MKLIYKIILCLCIFINPMCMQAQNAWDDSVVYDTESAAISADYLYVDVSGRGTVYFTMPIESNVVANGTTVSTKLSTEYGTIPGIAILVTFKVSIAASVTTSDGQSFIAYPNETNQITIKNLYHPQITINFHN